MSDKVDRRGFIRKSLLASGASALAFTYEERALLARPAEQVQIPRNQDKETGFPIGKIGRLQVSRIICGGNLISGFAHSRDLIYVSSLLRQYFTDDKCCETLDICESRGINTAILRVDQNTVRILKKYRQDWGGQMQWIAQAKINDSDPDADIKTAIDNGAEAVYIHGGVCDSFIAAGKIDMLTHALEVIKKNGAVAGLAGHMIEVHKAVEKAGLESEFYMKTLNAKNYWSAGIMPRHDSVWSETPQETIKFMQQVEKPWIAYKVLGAGAIHPRQGFQYAFENGADFLCIGMFDFQVAEDVMIAKQILASNLKRQRPWRG